MIMVLESSVRFTPLITLPTNLKYKTLIDNMWNNHKLKNYESGILT